LPTHPEGDGGSRTTAYLRCYANNSKRCAQVSSCCRRRGVFSLRNTEVPATGNASRFGLRISAMIFLSSRRSSHTPRHRSQTSAVTPTQVRSLDVLPQRGQRTPASPLSGPAWRRPTVRRSGFRNLTRAPTAGLGPGVARHQRHTGEEDRGETQPPRGDPVRGQPAPTPLACGRVSPARNRMAR